jgi:hypothetical protein
MGLMMLGRHMCTQQTHQCLSLTLGIKLSIEKLKSHNSPGTDQIPAELIKAGGRTIPYEIHTLVISIWKKEELP